jgi:hypothetical protein
MKRQFGKTMQRIAAFTIGAFLMLTQVAQAENNTGVGDVAGDGTALVDSNIFVLNSAGVLTLVKSAYLTNAGTRLASGATVPTGTLVDFLIYVNNVSDVTVTDTSIGDTLNALFTYQAGTIRVLNTGTCAAACTPAEEDVFYAATAAVGAGSDAAAAGDTVSYDGVGLAVHVGNSAITAAASDQQNAANNAVLAVVFTVQVQ